MCLHLQAGSDLCPRRRDAKRDAIGQAAAIWPRAANVLATRNCSVGESSSNQRTELLPESDSTAKRGSTEPNPSFALAVMPASGQRVQARSSHRRCLKLPFRRPTAQRPLEESLASAKWARVASCCKVFFFRWSVVAERGLTSEGAFHTKFESERARRQFSTSLSRSSPRFVQQAAIEAQDRERHFFLFRRACREDGESQQGSEARPASRCLPAC